MFKPIIKKAIVFIIVLFVLIFCWQQYNQRRFKNKIFKFYIADPIPETVEVINGSYHWGFAVESICLSFKTDEETFNSFVEHYDFLTKREIEWVRSLPLPELPENAIGYGKWKPGNKGPSVVITLFWDKATKTAYLRAMRGSVITRQR